MKDVNEFVNDIVRIDLIDDTETYGHYPFQLFVENIDGSLEMCALALGGNVDACYRKVREYKNDNAKKVFMSLDFPSGGDIDNDFVAIFSLQNDKPSVFAIPYNTSTGEMHQVIKESDHLVKILENFKQRVFN